MTLRGKLETLVEDVMAEIYATIDKPKACAMYKDVACALLYLDQVIGNMQARETLNKLSALSEPIVPPNPLSALGKKPAGN